jgi:DNA repair exonuclease SbcCD nuclease subunit
VYKFIHAADIYLDSPLQKLERYEDALVYELCQATRRALENLVELALAERTDVVIIAGDRYAGDWRDHNTGLFFVSQMTRLRTCSPKNTTTGPWGMSISRKCSVKNHPSYFPETFDVFERRFDETEGTLTRLQTDIFALEGDVAEIDGQIRQQQLYLEDENKNY